MKKVFIADTTLCASTHEFSFKESLEIAKCLSKLKVDVIELPEIKNPRSDILLVRTIASFVKKNIISVSAGYTDEGLENAIKALDGIENARIRIEAPCSPVGMEYALHKKAPKLLDWVANRIAKAKDAGIDVEFCALDATRAEDEFLTVVIGKAIEVGASVVTLGDDSASMLPECFSQFCRKYANESAVFAVKCSDRNALAVALSVSALDSGISEIKTTAESDFAASLEKTAFLLENLGNSYGFETDINYPKLRRITNQIERIISGTQTATPTANTIASDANLLLNKNSEKSDVISTAQKLGYDLSAEDEDRVYTEFCRVAEKKDVGAKELEAIIASTALQVPETYHLESYIINSGNIISASAQITLKKDDEILKGISIGDGAVDAAFLAIEQIIGHKYELDDFQIQSVTEGKEAVGSAVVKLRSEGRLYSGNGISTDILGASIRAYISAVNKISYEETHKSLDI